MDLPEPPDWREAAKAETVEEWADRHFVTIGLVTGSFTACLTCASLVVPGQQRRHWRELHSPVKGGL